MNKCFPQLPFLGKTTSHSTRLQTTATKSLVIPLGLKVVFLVRLLARLRERIEVRGFSKGESWIGGAKR